MEETRITHEIKNKVDKQYQKELLIEIMQDDENLVQQEVAHIDL